MKKTFKKLLAILIALVMSVGIISFTASAADVTVDLSIVATSQIQTAIASVTGSGGTVAVIGAKTDVSATLALNIPAGVTVEWQADYIGEVKKDPLLTLSGGGVFDISGSTINNTGTGGAINITGAGLTVIADAGGTVLSDRSGNAILISANGAKVSVNSGGAIRSLSNNTNAAIQIGVGIQGVEVLINGGEVLSDVGGNAINDSANGSAITILYGVVSSGNACAILSTGIGVSVAIEGGRVSNAAASNANPTIYINGDTGDNVIISDGTVENTATNATSYTIQTTGNFLISGGAVITANGRAINLVGMNSNAVVGGGAVRATGSGTAICTATTAPGTVAGASVLVSGGEVSATTGYAIRVTGARSEVTVSGGVVSATVGNAINADSSATDANIFVEGGQIAATTGYAIRATGTNSQVTVNNGFVFAYGGSRASVIPAPNIKPSVYSPGDLVETRGIVCSWDYDRRDPSYIQGQTGQQFDLICWTAGAMYFWYNHPSRGSGINYSYVENTGFFPLPEATVINNYGLIFDASDGKLYSMTLFGGKGSEFHVGEGTAWVGVPQSGALPAQLTLNGFSWVTTAQTSLTIIGGDTTITVNGNNKFEGAVQGVNANGYNITIDGGGTLTARSSDVSGNYGLNIGAGLLTLNGGTLIAQGWQAISWTGGQGEGPSGKYYRWAFSSDYDGIGGLHSDAGTGPITNFQYYATDKYVMLQALEPVKLIGAMQTGGVNRMADSTGIVLTFDNPVTDLTADDIEISNNNPGAVEKGTIVSGSGTTWTITLDSVFAEGAVSVTVNNFGNFYVDPNMLNADVYRADTTGLIIECDPPEGGITLGDGPGNYLNGSSVEVTAAANSGYHFSRWTIATLTSLTDYENPAIFTMPGGDQTVNLTAHFELDPVNEPQRDFGLIFDSTSGIMYKDITGTGLLSENTVEFTDGRGSTWYGEPRLLTLYGFSWITGSNTALTIVGDTTISLNGDNKFESEYTAGLSRGIRFDDSTGTTITIEGSGTLTAIGSDSATESYGIDLSYGNLYLSGGTFTAQGMQAILKDNNTSGPGNGIGPSDSIYYSWKWSKDYNGGGNIQGDSSQGGDWNEGFYPGIGGAEFEYYTTDEYVKLQKLEPIYFDAVQTGGEKGTRDSTAIEITFSRPIPYLTPGDIDIQDGTGAATKGYSLTNTADGKWSIDLSSVSVEGTVMVWVRHFGGFFLEPEVQSVDVYKAQSEPDQGNNGGAPAVNPPEKGGSDVSQWLDTEDHAAYVQGVGNNLFEPDREISRAEVAQMFYNLLLDKNVEITDQFPDVPQGAWYENAVDVLASIGILTGYPDGAFHPKDSITRAEFIAIATRFAKFMPEVSQNLPFGDISETHWAYNNINAAVQYGWIMGYEDGSFRPNRAISRVEAVTIVNRMLDRAADRAYIDSHPEITRYTDVPETYWGFDDIMEAATAHNYARDNGGAEVWN